MNGRIIVTYGRSLIALMIAQSLGARGVDVIGCDDVGMTVLSFSKYVSKTEIYSSPHKDEEAFIADLLEIVKRHAPESGPYMLIPAFNEAKILAKYRKRFEGLITLACPDYAAMDKVSPKDHFAHTVLELGLEAPPTWLPKDMQALDNILDEIEYPVFIKPPDDVGGRGISKIEGEADLKLAFTDLEERYPGQQILIQAAAKGEDYCYCGLFDDGQRVASMVYHNLETFPKEAGPGVTRETVDNKIFDGLVEDLVRPLKWNGVIEIDFMWDGEESTTPQMIEVNPRFWAGLDHSVKSNVDFPYLVYRLFLDGQVDETVKADIGKKTSLPALSTMARIESLFSSAIHFEDLEEQWPSIKEKLKHYQVKEAIEEFKSAIDDSITFDEAYETFKALREDVEEAERISYGKDDPFIGLGVLFVLGSLIKHGKLPPEVSLK